MLRFHALLNVLKKKQVNSPFNVMKCGHLQGIKIINNGCGQRLIQKLKKLWVFTQGKEEKKGQHRLWNSLPGVLRPCAVCYTDFWSAYELVFPDSRHKSVGKETGLTAYIERLNNTLRQRISRLVRKTLSFSKKLITIQELFGISLIIIMKRSLHCNFITTYTGLPILTYGMQATIIFVFKPNLPLPLFTNKKIMTIKVKSKNFQAGIVGKKLKLFV